MVGPNYQQPQICMPETFSETNKMEAQSLQNWWKSFDDPLLNRIIETAILQNLDLKIALDRIVEARAFFYLERANLFPEVDAIAAQDRSRISQNLFDSPFLGPPLQDFYQVGFDASWEIDFFGKLRRAKESAYYQLQAESEQYRDVFITTISEAARFYVEIQALGELTILTEKRIALFKETLELNRSLFKSGLGSLTTLEEVKAEVAVLESTLPDLQNDRKTAIYALAIVLGEFPECMEEYFKEIRPTPYTTETPSLGIPCELLRRRPDVRRAERQLAAATADIGVAVGDLFPTITLTGSYRYESNAFRRWFKRASRAWNIGPNIDWAILDFGRIRSNIRSKEALREEAFHTYMQTILAAVSDVDTALSSYLQEHTKRQYLINEVEANIEVLRLSYDLFQAGLQDYQSFLQAERNYVASKEKLIDSEKKEMLDLIALYKSIGGEW